LLFELFYVVFVTMLTSVDRVRGSGQGSVWTLVISPDCSVYLPVPGTRSRVIKLEEELHLSQSKLKSINIFVHVYMFKPKW